MSSMWTSEADDPRTYGNPQGEKETLVEYLGNYRLTLEMKCDGLSPEQLATHSVPPSTLSLLGLIRHMAAVEHRWFQKTLQGLDVPRLYDKDLEPDADFDGAVGIQECVSEAFAAWKEQIKLAEKWFEAVPESDLGIEVPTDDDTISIRDVIVHMIEEYARHCGHADLLRECIDGRTGQ